ncbi:hypothetical protein [Streptomyces sp. NPDC051546]|uniref:hypothetical protein n=1 Tax=Streptomyces sp. NPDC051546 TaxID=3365655 RepID=UPI00378FF034
MNHRQRVAVCTALVAAMISPLAAGAAHAATAPTPVAVSSQQAANTTSLLGVDPGVAAKIQEQAKGRKIIKVSRGVNTTLALTEDGTLLGAATKNPASLDDVLKQAAGKKIIDIAAPRYGPRNVDDPLALTADGVVLGAHDDEYYVAEDLNKAAAGRKISHIAATDARIALATTEDGTLIGTRDRLPEMLDRLLVQTKGHKITAMAASMSGLLAASEDGILMGSDRQGTPAEVADLVKQAAGRKITHVSTGTAGAMAVTDDGSLLGAGSDVSAMLEKAKGQKITDVHIAYENALVLTGDGTLLGTGTDGEGLAKQAEGQLITQLGTGYRLSVISAGESPVHKQIGEARTAIAAKLAAAEADAKAAEEAAQRAVEATSEDAAKKASEETQAAAGKVTATHDEIVKILDGLPKGVKAAEDLRTETAGKVDPLVKRAADAVQKAKDTLAVFATIGQARTKIAGKLADADAGAKAAEEAAQRAVDALSEADAKADREVVQAARDKVHQIDTDVNKILEALPKGVKQADDLRKETTPKMEALVKRVDEALSRADQAVAAFKAIGEARTAAEAKLADVERHVKAAEAAAERGEKATTDDEAKAALKDAETESAAVRTDADAIKTILDKLPAGKAGDALRTEINGKLGVLLKRADEALARAKAASEVHHDISDPDEVRLKFDNKAGGNIKLQFKVKEKLVDVQAGSKDWFKLTDKDGQAEFQLIVVGPSGQALANGGVLAQRDAKGQLTLTNDAQMKLPEGLTMVHNPDTNQYILTWNGK